MLAALASCALGVLGARQGRPEDAIAVLAPAIAVGNGLTHRVIALFPTPNGGRRVRAKN